MFTITEKITKEQLSTFCVNNSINKLSLFGSALNGELKETSDIDLLVEFKIGQTPGLLSLAGMELELTKMLGRKVDLRTPAEFSRYFRDEVISNARVEYEKH